MSLINNLKTIQQEASQQGGTLLHVTIRNREKVIFDDNAIALSSANNRGGFDVLAQHINFISIIKDYITIYKPDKTKQEYKLRIGLMKVSGNRIEIYVGIAPQNLPQLKKIIRKHPV